LKLKPKKVDIGNLPVYRALNARNEFASLKEFYEKTLKKTGRDRTVQRESVWREKPPKQAEYMSAVAFGYSQTSLFHLVNIEESIKYLLPKAEYPQDYQYIDHLRSFLQKDYETLHVDGGNRSDTIIDWYDNKVPLLAGQYPLPEHIDEDGNQIAHGESVVTLAIENYYTRQQLVKDGGDYARLAFSIDDQPFSYFEYDQLNEEDRKRLFINLNANENLITEEFRNCETAPICGLIRDLNDKYKEKFVEYDFITKANAQRYKFCSWLASLLNFYTFNNSCDSWAADNLDKDYKGTTGAQDNFHEFKKYFESTFYPLVEIIANYEKNKLGDPKGFKNLGPHRNLLVDLWIVLVRLSKKDYKITKDKKRRLKLKEFFEAFKEWVTPYLNDSTPRYNANSQTLCTFSDLYGANSATKLKDRLKLLDTKFIPVLIEKGLVVKTDVKRSAPSDWRPLLWKKQKGMCALTGKKITQDDARDGVITHMDHIIPHSKGGKTEMGNMQLVLAEANLIKSDK